MSVMTEKTVRELALEMPVATRVFEKLGIDYCCGGNRTLEQACQAARVPLDQAVDSLEVADLTARAAREDRDWQTEPLSELIEHIKNTHHKYVREETARLKPLFDKVCSVHGTNHPELVRLRATFASLAQELATHMMKEEMILFPYVVRLEEAVTEKTPVVPPPFGSVRNPVAMMMHEHDGAGNALREMRQVSNGYTAPADACVSYRTHTRRWRISRQTCTITFIWKTTSCFHARSKWNGRTEGTAAMSEVLTRIETQQSRRLTPMETFDITAARETGLSRLLMVYITTGLIFMLFPGTFLGVWNLLAISSQRAPGSVPAAWVQAHGHAQIFGWIGTFILGIGFYSIPKLRRLSWFALSAAWVSWALWTSGVLLRWLTGVYQWQWRLWLPVSAVLELTAFLIFFRSVSGHRPENTGTKTPDPWVFVVIAGSVGLMLTLLVNLGAAVFLAFRGASPELPPDFDQRFLVLETWGFLVPFVWGFSAEAPG